jgi:hypothetical protein
VASGCERFLFNNVSGMAIGSAMQGGLDGLVLSLWEKKKDWTFSCSGKSDRKFLR